MLNPLSFIGKIFKNSNQKEIDKILYLLNKVNSLEKEVSKLDQIFNIYLINESIVIFKRKTN